MSSAKKCFTPIEPIGAFFPDARLAEAWIPYQYMIMVFDPANALGHGTLFPELVRPYEPDPNSPGLY